MAALGDRLKLRIESLAHGGAGVAHHEGMAIFVPGTVPGDLAEVGITEIVRRFARGKLISVLDPSLARVTPRCPHFDECGGCDWQMMDYAAQVKAKTEIVCDCLIRIGKLPNPPLMDTIPAGQIWHYRNKAEFAVGESNGHRIVGYLRAGSHQVVPITDCAIQHPTNIKLLHAVQTLMESQDTPPLAQVIGRVSFATGEALAILVTSGEIADLMPLIASLREQMPELVGVLGSTTRHRPIAHRTHASTLWGRTWLLEHLGEWQFRVSADSFFQVNPLQAPRLLQTVLESTGLLEGRTLVDGYCGVGAFTIPLGSQAKTVHAVESDESALRDARHNLSHYHLRQARLWSGRVERILPSLADRGVRSEVLVLDPPRAGCGTATLQGAVRLQPSRVVMVSCDPATLARDLRTLIELGYELVRVQPVDLFPQTWHVECVAVCEKHAGGPSTAR